MTLNPFGGLALALMIALPAPAFAETSLTAYDAARQALLAIWAELPLSVAHATLTDGPATGYGAYTPHEGQVFAPGETIHVYAEVLGYGATDNGDGTVTQSLDADLALLDARGTTVAAQEKFYTSETRTRERRLESFVSFSATLTAFAPGDYTLRYVLHDRAGGKEATFELPITLSGDAAPSGEASPAAQ